MNEPTDADLAKVLASISDKLDHLIRNSNETRQLVGPFAASFPDGSMLAQTIHGLKYFIDPNDLIIAPQMVIYRQWEADISQIFRSLCTPDSVVVDVGANFGYFSILAADRIGQKGTGCVFAFEPNPELCNLFKRNVEINWSISPVTLHEVAVADRDGKVFLHVPQAHGANASLSAPKNVECSSLEVPVVRLDALLPKDIAVDIMKVDVEGHEAAVLRGAQEVLARSRNLHLILEWSRKQMAEAGIEPLDLISLLDGFVPHRIALGSGPLDHPETFDWLLAQDYTDVLFVRR